MRGGGGEKAGGGEKGGGAEGGNRHSNETGTYSVVSNGEKSGSVVPDGGDGNVHVESGETFTGSGRGIGVIFHNETTLNGEVVCDRRCLGVSGMLGLEGNRRFTFAWFANDEDLERRFPKL